MIQIEGTYDQHRELLHWAHQQNEKIVQFITKLRPGIHLTEKYVIIEMPEAISKWMVFNCHLPFIRDFYLDYYNITEIPYGEEIERHN